MSPKSNKFFTILIVPEKTAQVKRIVLSRLSVAMVLITAITLLSTFVFLFVNYVRLEIKLVNYNNVLHENFSLKNEVRLISARIEELQGSVERVKVFNRKLREITQLSPSVMETKGIGPLTQKEFEEGMSDGSIEDQSEEKLKVIPAAINPNELRFKKIFAAIQEMESETKSEEGNTQVLYDLLIEQKSLLDHTPSIWPTEGWVTSAFGYRVSPFTGRKQFHEGLDIANQVGSAIIAPADGVVVEVERKGGLGKMITIDHNYGVYTRYGHLHEYMVRVGQHVKRGEKIATIGNTGRSTGPHLHYEVVLNNVSVDPRSYILE